MKCLRCQFDNRKGAKFCLQCGVIIELRCSRCNTLLPVAANYCDYCGKKLGEPSKDEKTSSVPESERKRVAVLFSDMSGYMAITERLDPEEVKE
ncbi:MAG TPA: zinc ribbon domain-containing protein, partial [Syntrophales bacterium]|nr:zinc ribbon domain-containing protein [Syntrophales bacterium]